MVDEWINPHDGQIHWYIGRTRERCKCCGSMVVYLECERCEKVLAAPLAAATGWTKHGHQEKWDRLSPNKPPVRHWYVCDDC